MSTDSPEMNLVSREYIDSSSNPSPPVGQDSLQRPPQERRARSSQNTFKELPSDEPEDVLFSSLYGLRIIDLNRPKKLHSLNGSMIRKIIPRLQEWAKSDMANVVMIKGTGPKAFCAGGDVSELAKDNTKGEAGQQRSTDYFALEYKLDHLIATYTKPYVAVMDGITMGGGVGLSVHAPIRIATERTVYAMPETTIGFFPDVGASFFLSRMPGAVGTYLALTSERLKGANVFFAGIATHYIHSTSMPSLEKRLAELRFKDYATLEERLNLIDSTIEEYCTGLPYDEPILIQGNLRKAIDRCFGQSSIPAIIKALENEEGETKAWAEKTLASLRKRSPTSVYVTLRQMQLGRNWSIAETFEREHFMASRFMRHPDFTEGVYSLLIRKDKEGSPDWKPATFEEIDPKRDVDPFFSSGREEKLRLLNQTDYMQYPHSRFGIPTEREVERVVQGNDLNRKAVVEHFVRKSDGKQGVRDVVQEIVNRMIVEKNGKAVWNFGLPEKQPETPAKSETSES